jgi:hypothetical protein
MHFAKLGSTIERSTPFAQLASFIVERNASSCATRRGLKPNQCVVRRLRLHFELLTHINRPVSTVQSKCRASRAQLTHDPASI